MLLSSMLLSGMLLLASDEWPAALFAHALGAVTPSVKGPAAAVRRNLLSIFSIFSVHLADFGGQGLDGHGLDAHGFDDNRLETPSKQFGNGGVLHATNRCFSHIQLHARV